MQRRRPFLLLVTAGFAFLGIGCGGGGSNPPTPSPPVTAEKPSVQQFSASPMTIIAGQSSTLSWVAVNASTVTIDGGIGAVPVSGQKAVSPGATTTYTLNAAGTGGTATASVTVTVTSPPPPPPPAARVSVLTHHNDNARTGQNLSETILTPANVNVAHFGKLTSYEVDGEIYAQPLVVPQVTIPGQGTRNVVYVATQHDSVYAFDADGRASSPLWKTSFINPVAGITPVSSTDFALLYEDITPEIGITGTPVIDAASGTLYVVAKTKENGAFFQRLHALDIATGAEKFGAPVTIAASVPGEGVVNDGAGHVVFDPLINLQRAALLLSGGQVYVAFGSHADFDPFHGWLFGYGAGTLRQAVVLNLTPNGEGGSIWQSGGGPAADAVGNIYVATANGTFDADRGGMDYGDSFLRLTPSLSVADWFTPFDQEELNAVDNDLGAGGPLLVPDQTGGPAHLLIGGGKAGRIYVVDRDHMGHFQADGDTQILQSLDAGGPVFCTPAFWQNKVYFAAINDTLKAYRVSGGRLTLISQSSTVFGYPGATASISASGGSSGIVWALQLDGWETGDPAVLHAYDAGDLSNEFYNSNQAGARDLAGGAVKFTVPTIANGKVYVGTQDQLTVYGLLGP